MQFLCSECDDNIQPDDCEKFFKVKKCKNCRTSSFHKNSITTIENSLWSRSLKVAKQWSSSNELLLPIDVSVRSGKSFFFNCETCGSEIVTSPCNLFRSNEVRCSKCSYISRGSKNAEPKGLRVSDVNDLLRLWDFEKNSKTPSEVSYQSNRRYYWLCDLRHSTLTSPANRFKGRRCGVCTEKHFVSQPEKEVRDFVGSFYEGIIEVSKKNYIYPYELDIVLPELKLAIEFNGDYWHSDKVIQNKHNMTAMNYHQMKYNKSKLVGLELLFVWEDDWYNKNEQIREALVRSIADKIYNPILKKLEV